MRLNCTVLFLFLLLSFSAGAQKLTGIWRGYFSSSSGIYNDRSGNAHEETYKYEVQIDQQSNNSVKGVTYSYKSSVFFGKAQLSGIYTASAKNLIIKETKMIELKVGDRSEPCLMTCYLDYSRIGKLEVLEGTFISVNIKDKGDCGSGKIYLERVPASDFKKEDFLTKKKEDAAAKPKPAETVTNKPVPTNPAPAKGTKSDNLATRPAAKPGINAQHRNPETNNNTATVKPQVKKPVEKPVVKNQPIVKNNKPTDRIQEEQVNNMPPKQETAATVSTTTIPQENQTKKMAVPKILLERENTLQKVITTSEENLEIALYDNGEIDNDTITVYHNNELVVSHGRLSNTPILVHIKCSKTDNHHELVVVADNLGTIPPNTAMMIINPNGKDRMEVFITSNEQRNAKVIINYVPKK